MRPWTRVALVVSAVGRVRWHALWRTGRLLRNAPGYRDRAGAAAVIHCLSCLGLAAPYMRAALKGPVPSADSFLLAALGVALLISATAFRCHCHAARGEALLYSVSPATAHGDATQPVCGTRSLS